MYICVYIHTHIIDGIFVETNFNVYICFHVYMDIEDNLKMCTLYGWYFLLVEPEGNGEREVSGGFYCALLYIIYCNVLIMLLQFEGTIKRGEFLIFAEMCAQLLQIRYTAQFLVEKKKNIFHFTINYQSNRCCWALPRFKKSSKLLGNLQKQVMLPLRAF